MTGGNIASLRPDERGHSSQSRRVLLTTSAGPTQSPFSTSEKRPPLGIGFLISVLRDAGHKVFFIDNYLQPSDFLETGFLRQNEIDCVGVYANTICYRDTQRMLKAMQRLRQTHQWHGDIIVGGPHTTVAPQTIPDFVDYVVQGEGERAIVDIVEGRVTQRRVRYPRMETLDELPEPAWDCFVNLPYKWDVDFFEARPVFTMNTSRGCPFGCTFCSVGSIWGKRYTCFSADRIVSDIEHVVQDYGAKGIYFREDNFTLDQKRLKRFCQLMIDKGIQIPWVCESRVSTLSRELVELMSRAGVRGFYFGVESGSQRMLDLMQKGITVEQIENAFRWCHEFSIKTAASVIVGVPGETAADVAATHALLERIHPTVTWPNVFVGIPDSHLYRHVLDQRLYEYVDDRGLVYLRGHDERVGTYYGRGWNAGIPRREESVALTLKPRVSVLMAVHNGERYVRQALESLYAQTYQDFEVVIVDDGSTDGTPEVLMDMKDSRTFIYRNAENLGLTKSLNIGLRLCRGDYVARMDADDISHPERLAKQVRLLDQDSDCLVVGCWCRRLDAQGHVTGTWEPKTEKDDVAARLLVGNCIVHGSAMMRRAALVEAGSYDERYPYAQDYELWLRLSEGGAIRNIAEHLYDLRDWKETISTSKKSLQRRYARTATLDACRRRGEPYVTIVIVHHSTPEFTRQCVDKVFESSDVPFEMLVVYSGSTDESLGASRSEHRIQWLSVPEDLGDGPALDCAMQYVRSKYVVVLDSRVRPTSSGWLNALIEPLDDEVLVSGVRCHRDYVHPACLAMETDTFRNYDLSFQPCRSKGDETERLGVTHWDVAEGISMKIRRLGYRLHYLERSDVPSPDTVGGEYGGVVYYQTGDTLVPTKPQQMVLETGAGKGILRAQGKHSIDEPVEAQDQGDITWESVVRARKAARRRRIRPRAAAPVAAPPGLSLSVILTTYNRPELLERVLAGFAEQTAPREAFEVVVVDDGSIPPVKAVADRFTGAINLKYRRQDNSGLAAARNTGIRAAEGDILLFSDDDDVPCPELVAEHLRSHREHPDETVAVLGHLDWHRDLQVTPLMYYVTHVGGEYFRFDKLEDGQFYNQWKWWGGLVSAKRSLLEHVEGPFDPRLRFGYEDTELMCRLMPRQVRILYNAKARSAVVRAVTFEDFCRRSTQQGRALHRVAAAHPDMIIPRYQLEHARAEYGARYADSLEEWTGKVAKFDALVAARMSVPGSVAPEHVQALYSGYRECFRGHLLKGYVEQIEAVESGRARISDPVNKSEPLPVVTQAARLIKAEHPAETKATGVDGRTRPEPLRITVVNSCTPAYDLGSSNLRIYHLLKILTATGHDIDHLYLMQCSDDARYKAAFDGAITFIKTAGTVNNFQDYLHFNGVDRLDCVWITNLWVTNYMAYASELARWLRRHRPETRIIVDTMDFHYKKYARRFELYHDEKDRAKAGLFLDLERQLYPLADAVLAVTEVERQNILEHVGSDCRVEVIPNIHTVLTDTPPLAQRKHLCFLGAFRVNHNADAVRWFCDEVFPLILKEAPQVEFHILGHGNEERNDAIKPHPNVKVVGYVPDAERALAGYRVFVCPMIYGAGMKGKIGVAAGAGTPVVTTPVGAEGFGLVDGRHCFVADDPREFAERCLRLLQDDALWHDLSANVRRLVHEQFSPESVRPMVQDVLDTVMSSTKPERPATGPQQGTVSPAQITCGQTVEPKVSVITACHNGERFLPECLDSICRQTFYQWELFLLDDGSTDGTRRIIEAYARRDGRIRPYYFDESRGPYARRKFAIARANSPFIVIQDCDDIMSPAKLDILYREITRDDRLAMVGSFYRTFLEEFKGLERTDAIELPLEHDEIAEKALAWQHAISHVSAIIRKSMFERIGAYDENPFAADAFWSAKLAEYARHSPDARFRNIPEYLTLYRVHATSQTQAVSTVDPRNRRMRYRQYCECRLRKIREKAAECPTLDIAAELRHCDCSDFLTRFKAHIITWESAPLDKRLLPQLLRNAVLLFNRGCYVSCMSILNGAQAIQRDLPLRVVHFDLLKAMVLYALDLREHCLAWLHREIAHHDSPAARTFLRDACQEKVAVDVQRWCAEHTDRIDLQIVPDRDVKNRALPLRV